MSPPKGEEIQNSSPYRMRSGEIDDRALFSKKICANREMLRQVISVLRASTPLKWRKTFPASAEAGWLRGVRKDAKPHQPAQTGWCWSSFLTSTPPSAPSKVASRYLLDVASTPPQLRRGRS